MRMISNELLDEIAEEFLAVKGALTHIHDTPMTFEQFLNMRLNEMRGAYDG